MAIFKKNLELFLSKNVLEKKKLPELFKIDKNLCALIEQGLKEKSQNLFKLKKLICFIVYANKANASYFEQFVNFIPERNKEEVIERGILIAAIEDNLDFFDQLTTHKLPSKRTFWTQIWECVIKNNSLKIVERLCSQEFKKFAFAKTNLGVAIKALQYVQRYANFEIMQKLYQLNELSSDAEILSISQIIDLELEKEEEEANKKTKEKKKKIEEEGSYEGEDQLFNDKIGALLTFICLAKNKDQLQCFNKVFDSVKEEGWEKCLKLFLHHDWKSLIFLLKAIDEIPEVTFEVDADFWNSLWMAIQENNDVEFAGYLCGKERYQATLSEATKDGISIGEKLLFRTFRSNKLSLFKVLVEGMQKMGGICEILEQIQKESTNDLFTTYLKDVIPQMHYIRNELLLELVAEDEFIAFCELLNPQEVSVDLWGKIWETIVEKKSKCIAQRLTNPKYVEFLFLKTEKDPLSIGFRALQVAVQHQCLSIAKLLIKVLKKEESAIDILSTFTQEPNSKVTEYLEQIVTQLKKRRLIKILCSDRSEDFEKFINELRIFSSDENFCLDLWRGLTKHGAENVAKLLVANEEFKQTLFLIVKDTFLGIKMISIAAKGNKLSVLKILTEEMKGVDGISNIFEGVKNKIKKYGGNYEEVCQHLEFVNLEIEGEKLEKEFQLLEQMEENLGKNKENKLF